MGLFRRGTQLLKLGSGLRDCCCRPEQPEECWCPDWCRYYWDWGGTTLFPAREYLADICSSNVDATSIRESLSGPLGILSTVLNVVDASVTGFLYNGGIFFSYGMFFEGLVSPEVHEAIYGFSDENTFGSYYVGHTVSVFCKVDSQGRASAFTFDADSYSDIRVNRTPVSVIDPSSPPYFIQSLTKTSYGNQLGVLSECQKNGDLFCFEPPPSFPTETLHLTEDIVFEFGVDGITVNGVFHEWIPGPVGVYGFGDIDNGGVTPLWKVTGDFPFEATVTLRRRDSCRPSACDCTASLTNRTVLFEGKEMTYGQLDNFYEPAALGDPYSGTWWEENPAGTFTRRDVENCDGTLNQRVKVVEIDCINEGGVDKWVAYLDHTCNERDDAICPGPADAQRVKQWTGFFLCDENGSPTGSPTELEVDYDVTSGTPAAECVDALQPPSFEFP